MKGLLKTIIIFIIFLIISSVIAFIFFDKFRNWILGKLSIFTIKKDDHDNRLSEKSIYEKINRHFSEFKNDIKKYNLYQYYSEIFNLDKYRKKNYHRKIKRITSIKDLNIGYNDSNSLKKALNKKLKAIFADSKKMEWSDAIIFLYNWFEIEGEIEALNNIKKDLADEQKDDYKENIEDLKNRKENLLKKLSN
ncbi:MAG: hypothetical protein K9N00_00020 [Candidatus Marinimicrobia bacterium]|nr:hypothetical protein [Candidatus Neomarinimicrobiota bacterium]